MITIVLPCSGEGTRLGLPFPKELAPLGPGRVLIDSCLDLIAEIGGPSRILLLENGEREATAGYIHGRLPEVPLSMVRRHGADTGLADAVIGLEPWLGDLNVLMLPDVAYDAGPGLVDHLASLVPETGFAVAAAKVPPRFLASLGALRVNEGVVVAYEDKPPLSKRYNAAWGMLAFSGLAGVRVMARSTVRQATAPVLGAPVAWMAGFRDCGTWDGYSTEVMSAFARKGRFKNPAERPV